MRTVIRWIVTAAAIVLVVALLGWARGDKHHRGDDVGSLGTTPTVLAAL